MTFAIDVRAALADLLRSLDPDAEVCYLLCFIDPATGQPRRYKHAGHYLGTTTAGRLAEHVEEHRQGRAAVLTATAREAGLDFRVARIWPGGHGKERQLKTRSGALYCPDCSSEPQPGTAPPRPGAEYLTRRQREARARDAQAVPEQKPERTPLWLLERTAVSSPPHVCGPECSCDEIEAAVSRILQDIGAEPRKGSDMFGRGARAAARERVAQEARQQAEADALFAEADRWADLAGEPAGFRREITRERAARVMAQLAEPLARDAVADRGVGRPPGTAPGLDASAAEVAAWEEQVWAAGERERDREAALDAEIDRLADLYPEPEVPGDEPGPDAARWIPGPNGAEAPIPGPWGRLMAGSDAAETARQREQAAAAAQRITLGEQHEHPGPQAELEAG